MKFAYVGLPFKSCGRGPDGYDCWGLARLFYSIEYGIDLPSYVDEYSASNKKTETSRTIEAHWDEWSRISQGQEKCGDIIVLRLSGFPTHIGVVIRKGIMLHILEGTNAVIESYRGALWKNRIIGIFRHSLMK